VIGAFDRMVACDPAWTLHSGLFRATIIDTEIGDNALIREVGIMANYVVKTGAAALRIGVLRAGSECRFGVGAPMRLGIESGGREVAAFPELTVALAHAAAIGGREDREAYDRFIDQYRLRCRSPRGVIEPGAVVRDTPTIRDTFIGERARIEGATRLENCAIISTPDEPTCVRDGAIVENAILQWGCHVGDMAIVRDSVLIEHSGADHHATVTHSVVGANTHVARGEVTASLVGPFVGMHHQSLCIATLWPDGKGNIGHGANVGSNHTGKAPDQELWCGEGIFFGLGVNIKFPSNFSRAPWSLFATGVTTLPQRIDFPFSLINTPAEYPSGVPAQYNELFPGWILAENLYTVMRNEEKFRMRNAARRTAIAPTIFRPEIIDWCIDARDRLRAVSPHRDHYTETEIPGTGKNFMRENRRRAGIDAYSFHVAMYALTGFAERVFALIDGGALDQCMTCIAEESDDPVWNHQRAVLAAEGLAQAAVVENLTRYASMHAMIVDHVRRSKKRDDDRGCAIIDDYADRHASADADPLIRTIATRAERAAHRVEAARRCLS
jgi:hypothetical protein